MNMVCSRFTWRTVSRSILSHTRYLRTTDPASFSKTRAVSKNLAHTHTHIKPIHRWTRTNQAHKACQLSSIDRSREIYPCSNKWPWTRMSKFLFLCSSNTSSWEMPHGHTAEPVLLKGSLADGSLRLLLQSPKTHWKSSLVSGFQLQIA